MDTNKPVNDSQLGKIKGFINPSGDGFRLDGSNGLTEHKDLGKIEANSLDGITINRTKNKIDPFVDIRKERLVDKLTGAPSKNFGIWVPDPSEEQGWKEMGVVSENYLLLTNKEVRGLALDIALESTFDHEESRIFWDGARFAHVIDFTDTKVEIAEGDEVGLSLITRTSYDKSWKFEAALMGKRFACDNGMLSGEFFAHVSFKHTGDSNRWKELVKQGLSIITHADNNMKRFVEGLRLLKKTSVNDELLRKVWFHQYNLGDSNAGKILNRYLSSEEPTLYGLLNAGTNVFWHNQKMTGADFKHNSSFVTNLLQYAFEHI
ncbi:MAG: DUF932 domain-containing protein [Bacteroidota bacterium]